MSDEAQGQAEGQGQGQGMGGWEPIPQSEGYDGDATAFVQLPPEFMLEGIPLEAPGHGYVPPMITPLVPAAGTDPGATGSWMVQVPVAAEPPQDFAEDFGAERPQTFEQDFAAEGPQEFTEEFTQEFAYEPPREFPQQQTASWTIPTIEDGSDVLDDSGEYTASRLARYASGAPATLPGGAAAPWAVGEPEPVPVEEPEPGPEPVPVSVSLEEPDAFEAPAADQPDQLDQPGEPDQPVQPGEPAPVDPPTDMPADLPTDMSTDSDEHPHTSYTLRVNGADRPVTDSWIGESLLYVLRERLGLAGAKDGCSQGECGACNVQVDGRLVASCLVPAATAAGSEVRTVEGLAVDGEPSDVQRALAKCGVQCGFCIPGMAMTVHDLLEGNHAPTELETRQALCGNLCRCSGYRGVLDAVREVVTGREAAAEAEAGDRPAAARIPHQIPHPHDGGTA
ncbi:2Fe-2S iron-sulfur cluster-binding protein [Streptomyces sp. NPDC085481]|uniref:2Fe-2S iron-sulfur cluster-binding protein n=1 Tax=Streptomyces sp. NPDC085481 TaxID=3365727 RepID=UPI0037D94661